MFRPRLPVLETDCRFCAFPGVVPAPGAGHLRGRASGQTDLSRSGVLSAITDGQKWTTIHTVETADYGRQRRSAYRASLVDRRRSAGHAAGETSPKDSYRRVSTACERASRANE